MSDPTEVARTALAEDRPLTLAEVAAEAGLDVDDLAAVFTALCRTDRDRFGARDLRYARIIAILRRHVPHDALLRSARVRQRAVASVVASDLALIREHLLAPALEAGADEAALGQLVADATGTLVSLEAELLGADYLQTLEDLLGTEVVMAATRQQGNELDAAVGFVDLVGYTELSVAASPDQLGDALGQFEDLVHGVVSRSHGTWLVKLIGDAAMLFSERVEDLVEVLLEVVDPGGALPDLPRRAGMAAGPVLVRDGDFFGPTVNLAARLTAAARPWSVLVDEDLGDGLDELLDVRRIPTVDLRGIGTRRPLRVRRAPLDGA